MNIMQNGNAKPSIEKNGGWKIRVIVNGQVVYEDQKITGRLPGKWIPFEKNI